ncbi:DUF421 domain-containing protein [Bacillus sp. 31A1R]|uniref:DUF421 domain-containing protein n=1 Tax=Robertmurraya mangrovi TaxID=3098077 RepID=A0ABU5J3Q0_9BACI|nr:DUF421 domain-containing protein [Bacillus sp. 31A1R]MDZ5473987.1 DUF421 domain-containing protein [Bacillus sp. 31A1R]
MDHVIDLLKVLGRIYTILPLLLVVTLMMGKRSIGELPVFDFLTILVLGSVVGADIADPAVNHLFTFIAVIAIGLLQYFVSKLKINHRKVGRLLTFEPTIVIYKGEFQVNNMKEIKYSLDNVLQMLREENVFNVSDVELAIIEANGKLSVKLIPSKEVTRVEHLHSTSKNNGLELPVIIDGVLYQNVLSSLNLNEQWLKKQLFNQGVTDVQSVFFASVNQAHEIHFSLKDDKNKPTYPLILH